MGRKIALLGNGDTWEAAPWDDPEWEIWTMGWKVPECKRVTHVFELHTNDQWYRTEYRPVEDYPKYLAGLPYPVMTKEAHPGVPNASIYPMAAVLRTLGWQAPNFASTPAYWLGYIAYLHAEVSQVDAVGMYGIELVASGEWAYQRPNTCRLLGFLEGRGVTVVLPPTSTLLGIPFEYGNGDEDVNDMANARMFESFAQMTDTMFKAAHAYKKWEDRQAEEAKARVNGGVQA